MFDLKKMIYKGDWSLTAPTAAAVTAEPIAPRNLRREKGREAKAREPRTDWDNAIRLADLVARKIPPRSETDRRLWLKFAALTDRQFSEHWLIDAVEAVLCVRHHERNMHAHFVGVLKAKAAEEGIDLIALARSIEVPSRVWFSDSCRVRQTKGSQ